MNLSPPLDTQLSSRRSRAAAGERVDRQRQAVAYAVVGQSAFLMLMLACCAIRPSWFAVRRGLSYYGNSVTTGVPYAAGFFLLILLTALAIARIDRSTVVAQRFRGSVTAVLALMALVPLTPYALDVIFDWLHIGVASVLFLAGLMLGGWIAFRLSDRVTCVLYVIESAAAISIVAAQVGLNDYMIPSELLFESAVFALVVQGIRQLARSHGELGSRSAKGPPVGSALL